MTFKGHLAGGVLAGIGVVGLAARWGYLPSADYRHWATVWGTTVFFSLFPDFDTSSVPQRWFFRVIFAGLIYLGWTGQYELATLVGILSILPLLDHHRGWTHWKISPLLVPVLLGAVYEYWQTRHSWIGGFSWASVHRLLADHLVFLVACVVGWYIHLLLDGCFKLFPTSSDHH